MRDRARARRASRARAAVAVLLLATVSACQASGGSEMPGTEGPTAAGSEPSPTIAPPATPPSDPSSWPLVWSDEFDGPQGSAPDPANWGYELGDGSEVGLVGWGNNERQSYTDSLDNAAADGDGNLLLTVRAGDGSQACYYGPCEYTSARLVTRDRFEVQYGRIEARIRVPEGFGLWPAFWMLGTDVDTVGWPASGEIDVMEYIGRRPNEVFGSIHGPRYSASSAITQRYSFTEPAWSSFHTFAIEWWSGHIAWYVDGIKYHEATAADVAPREWVFDHPFFLILNVAVGGNLGGPVDPDLALPASMAVDYVRVYQAVAP